ncbi:MAG: YqgE/AlgH family protein [Arenibacterium sp.]
MDLTGKILIAMPGMGDPRFERSVVFMCSHSDEGAMGLIVNKPVPDLSLSALLGQLEIPAGNVDDATPVYFGGPVEGARGFVLHSPDYTSGLHSLDVSDVFSMTATLDILEDLGTGDGPEQALMVLGYAGWGPGQLEGEIAMNGWLTGEASPELVYETEDAVKWETALKTLGVDPLTLSASAGRA